MSDDPTARNRLDGAASPYLRQHADNPVNWQPWDDAALDAAREREVPIFLSVGYSACHWCHVMADESFQDETVARRLNDWFVPIKVDREERPDLDRIYQTIGQLTTGQGGWPLSAFLTPEGEPFFVGTYFPREPRRGMPGFADLLEDIHESWVEDRESVTERAAKWTDAVRGELEETPEGTTTPDGSALTNAASAAVRGADRAHGGWGRGQKFPQTGRVHVLLRAHARTGESEYLTVAREALDAMVDGGLYDHVGGGFHRYCTDRDWTVPHFEKMLYDNAEIARALVEGYRATGEDRYRERARETLDFVSRDLQHPEGGFFSTLSAQSEGADGSDEEGAFYVWTPQEVREAVTAHEADYGGLAAETAADLLCDRYGVTEQGNFEGATVLTVAAEPGELAGEYDLDEATVEATLDAGRDALFEAREDRPRPDRDEKVLAGWNGLMVSAYAEAALADGPDVAAPAEEALAFVREHLWDADAGRLSRRFRDGDVAIEGYLEDYAFLARGAFDLYQATGAVEHLAFALALARTIEADFWDADAETLYFTPADGEDLLARPQELTDQSTPSSAGVAAETLLALNHFVPHGRFADVAEGVLGTHGGSVESDPLQHASLVLAADRYASGSRELTVAADALPSAWRERVGETLLPARILSLRPPTSDGLDRWLDTLGLAEAPPIWAERDRRDGEPTVYACRQFTCSPPHHDVEAALAWFADEEA
ncbi:MAG: thioredoxin domain-containing protein [Halorientalis sp.]